MIQQNLPNLPETRSHQITLGEFLMKLSFVHRTIFFAMIFAYHRRLTRKIMYIVDDPMLALITRFMGDTQHLNVSDAEFLLRQITAVEQYVEQFPLTNEIRTPWNGSPPMLSSVGGNGKKTRLPSFWSRRVVRIAHWREDNGRHVARFMHTG
jgi:hypothetical protein